MEGQLAGQRVDSIHLLHQHVQDDQIRTKAVANLADCFSAGPDGFHLKSVYFQKRLQILSNAGLVVDDQNRFFSCCHYFSLYHDFPISKVGFSFDPSAVKM